MNVNQINPNIDVQNLSDEELVMAHMTMHAYYKEFQLGRGKEGWDLESLVQTHDEIRQEMEGREELQHDYVSALDNESAEAVQMMEVQMGHKDEVAKEWVEGLLQADDVDNHIRQNPPEANWYPKAVEFLQEEDSTIDLTEHVSFAAQSYDTLDESVQEWVQDATGSEVGAVGYYFNDDTETGVLLAEQGDGYGVFVDETEAAATDSQIEALQSYNELSRLVRDGSRRQHALNQFNEEPDWEISQEGEFVATRNEDDIENGPTVWGHVRYDNGALHVDNIEQIRQENASGDTPVPANLRDEVDVVLQGLLEEVEQAPSDAEEVEQGEVRPFPENDYYWYVWKQDEAEAWLQSQGVTAEEPEREGPFISYQVNTVDDYDRVENEWFGPAIMPYKFVDGIDERPVLATIGINEVEVGEDITEPVGEVIKYKFLVEEPPQLADASQMDTIDTDLDYYWWKWDRTEIKSWARERDYPTTVKDQGKFTVIELQDAEKYETLHKAWKGKRSKPDSPTLAGGDKPRRVVYGETSDGEKEVQAIEFLTTEPVQMMAEWSVNEF